jgi:hypothetical protein
MANVYHLPKRKPNAAQLELPRAEIIGIRHDLNMALIQAQSGLITASTADEFAQVLTDTHRKLAEADAGNSPLSFWCSDY